MGRQQQIHQGQPVLTAGQPLSEAQAAMVLLHGRGASAASILMLADELNRPNFAFVAPQAAGYTWYPYSFLNPVQDNEPHLSSALSMVESVLADIDAGGIPLNRVILLGFSQGACLATEYAARHAQEYGGIVGLSGGLIGPPGTPRNYEGSLEGTPVFLGCSDIDPHIPEDRVKETARVLEEIGGEVTMQLYPGMGHTVNEDEIERVQQMMDRLLASGS